MGLRLQADGVAVAAMQGGGQVIEQLVAEPGIDRVALLVGFGEGLGRVDGAPHGGFLRSGPIP